MPKFAVLFCLLTIIFSLANSRPRKLSVGEASIPIHAKCPMNFGITVTDAEKTAQWYEAMLGLVRRKTATFPKGKVIILGSPDLEVEVIQHESSVDARKQLNISEDYLKRGIFKIGFYVDDLDAAVTRLKERKVHFYMEKGYDDELRLRFAIITDVDGNTIQLFQREAAKKQSPK